MYEVIGVVGAGTMGAGIAQVTALGGRETWLTDTREEALAKALQDWKYLLARQVDKGRLTKEEAGEAEKRLHVTRAIADLAGCQLVIEAIVEEPSAKRDLFGRLEQVLPPTAILATNTSSLSVTAIAGACAHPHRVIGIHFFNPAYAMPLVEIIPALQTSPALTETVRSWVAALGKDPVVCRDLPGFIVNRIARPFYGEALRILEEGLADTATIDASMRDLGFRMGPFELMDLIGNDVNYAVTESVFRSFYYDPRYRPSLTQKRMVEAGWLGRKSGRGYYSYANSAAPPSPKEDAAMRRQIGERILMMLINEACEALYLNVASEADIERAMTRGVNYPKGLIAWGREIGREKVSAQLDELYATYREDRYRRSPGTARL